MDDHSLEFRLFLEWNTISLLFEFRLGYIDQITQICLKFPNALINNKGSSSIVLRLNRKQLINLRFNFYI